MKLLYNYDAGLGIMPSKSETAEVSTHYFQNLQEAQQLAVFIAEITGKPNENLVICELLNNAVEHGNLGISYEEKSELLEQDKFLEEIERRLLLPENKEKYAEVVIEKYTDRIIVNISDKGLGFNYQKYLAIDQSRIFENHGRGIAIANTILNIQYLGKGNSVKVLFNI